MIFVFLDFKDLPQWAPYLEARDRYERRINKDFSSSTNDARSDLFSRYRPGVTYRASDSWAGEFQYQYAHDLFWTVKQNASVGNSDLSMLDATNKQKDWTFTMGRQKITIGNQKLIGLSEWTNGRSWDAVRAQDSHWDFWGGSLGLATPRPKMARVAMGLYKEPNGGSTAIFVKHDSPTTGNVDVTTLDQISNWKIGRVAFDAEAVGQAGKSAHENLRAWAGHLRARLPLSPSVRLFAEGDAGSGGTGPHTVSDFDILYPSKHDQYGSMDLISWRNMTDEAIGAEWSLGDKATGKVSMHKLGLENASDYWYFSDGTIYKYAKGSFIDPTGKSGKDLGQELDFQVAAPVCGYTLMAGVSTMDPGRFVRDVAGKVDPQVWAYFSVQKRF